MLISPAYAQSEGIGGFDPMAFLPLVLIFVVFYFLLIRPQQKKMKQHREMLSTMRRGDKVVTGGGIIGTVSKVDNGHEVTVEISKDVKVKVRRDLISMVLSKTEPVAGQPPQAANEDRPQSLLGKLFGGGAEPA
ncbi:MAG: preprotein translocase subunit YajC, partial [Proteobacteria bacterium]|nr:preprotein translocase subunit YajC [Pseudomonadota bacterium]